MLVILDLTVVDVAALQMLLTDRIQTISLADPEKERDKEYQELLIQVKRKIDYAHRQVVAGSVGLNDHGIVVKQCHMTENVLESVRTFQEDNPRMLQGDGLTLYETLDQYLQWNGIMGYTPDILRIIKAAAKSHA